MKFIYFIATLMVTLFSLPLQAQEELVIQYGDCTPPPETSGLTRGVVQRLPSRNTNWDAEKIYKQMVILVEFCDMPFTVENPTEFYNNLFNQSGFNVNKRNCKGCVADYFRDQSGGLLNLQFDIYGPVTVSQKAQPYDNPTESTKNYGRDALREATLKIVEANPDVDYGQYCWKGAGSTTVNQVIYIFAGPPGNVNRNYGYVWPNTSSFTSVDTPDGKTISNYSCSGEHWPGSPNTSCGIGTVCHEFTHSLGLPDLYCTDGSSDNVVIDMWDLMDGGNFTNYGFCPPNYSPLEKILLGWKESIELTEPMTEDALNYGKIYKIKNTDTDYYLLETRKQEGWDEGVPGKGLVVFHVKWDAARWSANTVNNGAKRYDLVHADGLDYYQWLSKMEAESLPNYAADKKGPMMNANALSGSPFPYIPAEGDAVTSFSDLPEKALTNILLKDDGTVSFDFMGGATALDAVRSLPADGQRQVFDAAGRKVTSQRSGQLYIVRNADGTLRKYIAK